MNDLIFPFLFFALAYLSFVFHGKARDAEHPMYGVSSVLFLLFAMGNGLIGLILLVNVLTGVLK